MGHNRSGVRRTQKLKRHRREQQRLARKFGAANGGTAVAAPKRTAAPKPQTEPPKQAPKPPESKAESTKGTPKKEESKGKKEGKS